MMHHWHFDIASAFIGMAIAVLIATGVVWWLMHDYARSVGDAVEKVVNDAPKL